MKKLILISVLLFSVDVFAQDLSCKHETNAVYNMPEEGQWVYEKVISNYEADESIAIEKVYFQKGVDKELYTTNKYTLYGQQTEWWISYKVLTPSSKDILTWNYDPDKKSLNTWNPNSGVLIVYKCTIKD